jgi:quercetin dioxygenase-like cupin family protein
LLINPTIIRYITSDGDWDEKVYCCSSYLWFWAYGHSRSISLRRERNMKKFVLLLIVALSCVCSLALSLEETQSVTKNSDATAIDSQQVNSGVPDANFSIVNLSQLAEQNPIDPQIGYLRINAAFGENASVNLTQIAPGAHAGAHYHQGMDEIDYVIQGQANMTLDGRYYSVQAGDLIYLPPFAVHDFKAIGNETLQIMVVFAPPFDGKDRIYV